MKRSKSLDRIPTFIGSSPDAKLISERIYTAPSTTVRIPDGNSGFNSSQKLRQMVLTLISWIPRNSGLRNLFQSNTSGKSNSTGMSTNFSQKQNKSPSARAILCVELTFRMILFCKAAIFRIWTPNSTEYFLYLRCLLSLVDLSTLTIFRSTDLCVR